jgi:hypothetical protein
MPGAISSLTEDSDLSEGRSLITLPLMLTHKIAGLARSRKRGMRYWVCISEGSGL